MLRLLRDSDQAVPAAPPRRTRPTAAPRNVERFICSDESAGGLTLYTFEDHRGKVIGYAQIAVAPVDGVIPREVVALYDLCVADAAARSLRMG